MFQALKTLEKRREVVQDVIDRLLQCNGKYLQQLELLNSEFEVKDQRIKPKAQDWINLEEDGIEVN